MKLRVPNDDIILEGTPQGAQRQIFKNTFFEGKKLRWLRRENLI